MYVNYGRRDDFRTAESRGVDVRGRVALLRLGATSVRDKVRDTRHVDVHGDVRVNERTSAVTPPERSSGNIVHSFVGRRVV